MSKKSLASSIAAALGLGALTINLHSATPKRPDAPFKSEITEGTLIRLDRGGRPIEVCPLKHTDVNGEISGFLARVSVTQEFANNSHEPIEAIYKFPLPSDAAVDDMEMVVGKRVIKGLMKEKQEARKMFEDARNSGRTAALLDQDRPNIFTQSVTNIAPGESVRITIRYTETLKYEDGSYEFVFPMVVGPRYTPASMTDPGSVIPNRTPEGTRAGHDINVKVTLDAGLPLGKVGSTTHDVDVLKSDPSHALVALRNEQTIPNKDFILRYDVAGAKVQDAVLTHADQRGGFLTVVLQPPARVAESEVTPKEIVFVVDTSGSMYGFPLEKSKEVIRNAFAGLHPQDTFNLITFSGDEHILFPKPVPATQENLRTAWEFLRNRNGSGGTEMMKAIRAALAPSDSQDHIRVVCFMTDGEVGNDFEILAEVQKHPKARVFAFGIGSSVNRFLLDGMARYGRGEVQYVGLQDDGSAAAKTFQERVQTPVLTDIEVDWNGMPVQEVFPARIPDLFSAKPVILSARYSRAASGTIRLKGKIAGRPYVREIAVNLPAEEKKHDVLASLWARRKIADLMASDFLSHQQQSGEARPETKSEITRLGIEYRLMTQYTSFIAVEDRVVNEGGQPRVVAVPVEMPEGVSYQGVYGSAQPSGYAVAQSAPMPPPNPYPSSFKSARAGSAGRGATAPATLEPAPKEMAKDVRREQPDEPRQISKLHPDLLNLDPTLTVNVQVWLNSVSVDVIAKLKKAGLTVLTHPSGGLLVTGRITASQLAQIEAIDEVRFISPAAK
ncbi:MAG TPA: VIT and VWA domain-containing protein [Bryobacteraceae bacterium]|jgi:Ca-activated chloride channel family protein